MLLKYSGFHNQLFGCCIKGLGLIWLSYDRNSLLVVSFSGQRVYGISQTSKVKCWMNSVKLRQDNHVKTVAEPLRKKKY